jgi:hypothetical protein
MQVNEDTTLCVSCVAGKFSETRDSTACLGCAEGKYSSAKAAFCQTVEAGYSVVKTGDEPELRISTAPCLANFFSTGSTDDCEACDNGGFR